MPRLKAIAWPGVMEPSGSLALAGRSLKAGGVRSRTVAVPPVKSFGPSLARLDGTRTELVMSYWAMTRGVRIRFASPTASTALRPRASSAAAPLSASVSLIALPRSSAAFVARVPGAEKALEKEPSPRKSPWPTVTERPPPRASSSRPPFSPRLTAIDVGRETAPVAAGGVTAAGFGAAATGLGDGARPAPVTGPSTFVGTSSRAPATGPGDGAAAAGVKGSRGGASGRDAGSEPGRAGGGDTCAGGGTAAPARSGRTIR